ncbi:flagellar hook-associated protein FlgK [Paenibacillus ehimensis]|uniref:Flagellar hook-associated protein 1 n=1 Tax=Paenibacillus ehimensis TaxID=79264 RepID=A0ABT8VD00_9BACL|nr:flagellar hook-associated protein FlgK [Paenibacillus ehimensis]MDO3678823.1 flagellar hook-associated protein FlgK [Paenibacillus ehimensis]
MRSTFHGIETAKRSLFTQQAALQTTAHNIANANTAGYSRQVVNMVASRPIEAVGMSHSAVPGQLGTGVEFTSITRVRERFLDDQFRNESKGLGSWTVQADTLEKLEAIMNEPSSTGIRTVIDNFWKSWSDLSKDPENVTGRKIVRENAMALADAFNYTSKQLRDLSTDLTNNVDVKATQMNSITTGIANLNAEIFRIEGLGDDANDLRDQRDLLVDQLSQIVNITVQDTDQGYNINMGTINLVNGQTAVPTSAAALTDAYNSGILNSGEVHGMLLSRERYVSDYQRQLDTLANTIANGEVTITIPKGSVLPEGTVLNNIKYTGASRTLTDDLTVKVNGLNGLHKLGYNLSDPIQAGGDFFTAKSGFTAITAESFQLNPVLAANPDKIATSMRTALSGGSEKVVKGNNGLALLISQLKDTKFTFASGGAIVAEGTVDDYFRSTVGQLGVQSKEATRQLENQKALVDQVDSRRQSVSGVSIDEEMSNMIKFQHAYGAASRAMTTFDEMLDKVINSMGVVGR